MTISLPVIIDALGPFQPEVRQCSGDANYGRVCLILDEERRNDTLYVGPGRSIVEPEGPGNCGFVSIGEPAAAFRNIVVLPDSCDLHEVFDCLQRVFLRFSEYELDLTKAAITGSYQELIEIGHRFMANPLFLLDSGYRVLALAPDVDIPGDREYDYIRRNGISSPELVKVLKDEGVLSMETRGLPQIYSLPGFPRASIWFNIYLDSRYAARIVVIDAFKSFSPSDQQAAKTLVEAPEMKMSRDEAFRYIRGKGPVYNMLHDLIKGVHLDGSLIADRLQYLPNWTKGFFRVLFVPLGSTDDQSFDYYARVMERKIDSRLVLFENALVAIIHYRRRDDFPAARDATAAFLSGNALRGGLSNELNGLADLHDSYRQAVAALELAESDDQLHLYEDYAVKHILSFCSPENGRLLSHPSLVRLKDFDNENGTRLSETLRTFLENERSLAGTSRALHIHRNTLLYRINKIAAILDVDLDDPNTRLHFLLSERLLKMEK